MLAISLWIGLFVCVAGLCVIGLGFMATRASGRSDLFGCGLVLAVIGLLIGAVSAAVHYIVRALP